MAESKLAPSNGAKALADDVARPLAPGFDWGGYRWVLVVVVGAIAEWRALGHPSIVPRVEGDHSQAHTDVCLPSGSLVRIRRVLYPYACVVCQLCAGRPCRSLASARCHTCVSCGQPHTNTLTAHTTCVCVHIATHQCVSCASFPGTSLRVLQALCWWLYRKGMLSHAHRMPVWFFNGYPNQAR